MNSKYCTFYSYKGGSGRTTTLLNTTKHLTDVLNVTKEHPILLIDADLESAGLTYFFNCSKKFTSRFSFTIHAEDFMNHPNGFFSGFIKENTFGTSKETLVSCDDIASLIAEIHKSIDVKRLFSGVRVRQTTYKILKTIVEAKRKIEKNENGVDITDNDVYFARTYELSVLLGKLDSVSGNNPQDVELAKREVIEEFLPADGMVDVSKFFGRPYGSVKFIGVDVAFNGSHSSISNETAMRNKSLITAECGKKGFTTILFDCGSGVQSTAHVLNHISDVIVYCMRPTLQFALGTLNQLDTYRECLAQIATIKNELAKNRGEHDDKKSVILLPTAVPYDNEDTKNLQADSFDKIGRISKMFSDFVDDTFCSYNTSLKEVALFKWREHILGVPPVKSERFGEEIPQGIELYSVYDSNMPLDARNAYSTYKLLAERICYNS